MLILKFTAALFSNYSKEHPLIGFICSFYISWWGPNLKLALHSFIYSYSIFLLTMNVPLFQLISVRGHGQGQMDIPYFPEQGLLILIFESLTGSLEAVLLKPNNNFNPPNYQQLTLVPFSSIHITSSAGDFIYFWSSEHLCPAAMEVNRDEAERCIDIATAALSNDQPEKAQRFLEKAQRLFPTAKAKGELK